MKKLILSFTFLLSCFVLYAQDGGTPDSGTTTAMERLSDLSGYLGATLESIIKSQGYPEEMYSVRGPSEGQDSVVFLYKNRLSFYWTDRHVWQVRIDQDFSSENMPLKQGMSREETEALLGVPALKKDDLSIYKLPQKGYPVACALYFDDGLTDLYIYRSDF